MVGADAQLGEQPEQEADHAREKHRHGDERQGRLDEGPVAKELVDDGRDPGHAAYHPAQEAAEPENVHRPLGETVEEKHDAQVEDHLEYALEAVFRHPVHPRVMRDGNLGDAGSVPEGVYGNEAVHLPVERDALKHLPAVGLQGTAVVVQMDAARVRDEAVRHAAQEVAPDRVVLPVLSPTRDQVVSLAELGDHLADIRRVILQVAVHRDDDLPAGVGEAGLHGGRLAVIAPEMDGLQAWVGGACLVEARGGRIDAAVIDEEHLVVAPEQPEGLGEFAHEDRDV